MEKVSNKLLGMFRLTDETEEEYEEEIEEQEEEKEGGFSLFKRNKKEKAAEKEELQTEEIPKKQPGTIESTSTFPVRETRRNKAKKNNIVSINNRGDEVKVVKPQSFNESKIITDYLKENKTVVVNLEGLDVGTAQRIIDCIAGASYALEGTLEQISNMIFILAPHNVEISGDIRDEFITESLFSPDLGNY